MIHIPLVLISMKSVFEASTGLEAHMILNLLQQEGIDGRVEGEYLQGGIGELQAINVVRVVVAESDLAKAKSIVSDWESKQFEDSPAKRSVQKPANTGRWFLFGLMVGIGGMYWLYNSPVTRNGVDYNRDGEIDEEWIFKANRMVRANIDRNRDGEIDMIQKYDRKGLIYVTEADDDFDGIYETKFKYRYGNLYLQESDLNQDGRIDYRAFFKDGVLNGVELLDPATNSPRKRQKYEMNKLVSAEYDSDGDGVYDVNYEYDYYEEIKTESNP